MFRKSGIYGGRKELKTINIPLLRKVCDVIFLSWAKHEKGIARDFSGRPKRF
jgi:hypothetical protein